jgi:hypothetical protein
MTATDQFYTYAPNLASPAVGAFTIVPHDTNELSQVTRALRIGTSDGTLSVVMADDSSLVIPVAALEIIPLRVKKVMAATTVDVWGLV